MQQGDYSSYGYYPFPHLPNHNSNPNPNPNHSPPEFHQPAYASAPPFTSSYAPSDHSLYAQTYPAYPQNPDPVPPTAPSYLPPSSTTAPPLPIPDSISSSTQPPPPVAATFLPYDSQLSYQPSASQPAYYQSYDQHQSAAGYAPSQPNSTPSPSSSPSYFSAPYGHVGNSVSSVPPAYENSYENLIKFDQGGAYSDDKYGGYGRSMSVLGPDIYEKRSDSFSRYGDDGYGDGVYAYEGKAEPYGARGTAPKSSTWVGFDDYGRSISFPSGKDSPVSPASPKIVRAVPESQQDVKSGVQKFRVKMLAESGGQSTMDVLCQIGLDGIHMLDPSTGKTLRIYPLETITRCEVMDSSTLAFWSKSSVDIEPRRIRLQSNSYTTNTLLDAITAATVQFKEMGGRSRPTEFIKATEQPAEKKKGIVDWINFIKPGNEEKDHWVPDEVVSKCTACRTDFGPFIRRHHCRNCGDIFCDKCTHGRIALTAEENAQPVRVCDGCMAEVTQRLSNAKESANKPTIQSHEDLARKLQEEMEKNRKSGSKSDGFARRMKEVACPTCTVHLQVQVPSSGSETIECGVCQHPFLVSAH